MVRCQVGAELRRAAHLGAVDDDDLDVEGGDERRELGEGGDRHPDHRRLLERGELELRVEARLQTEGKRVSMCEASGGGGGGDS